MSIVHDRVIAALERREPDRVPTMDLVSEYSAVYEILGKKRVPMARLFKNPYSSRFIDRFSPLLNRLRVMETEVERFTDRKSVV